MSEDTSAKASQAEARTEETRSFIRQVKRRTRRKFTAEEKIRIVLEGVRHEVPVRELCRRPKASLREEGISPNVYYAWLKRFMEGGKERITGDTRRGANRAEVEELKRENTRLKQLVAELSLEVYLLKRTAIPGLEG